MNCVGIGGAKYRTDGKATVKITLGNEFAYEFSLWVGELEGQDLLLGMDFMIPAGVRLDAGQGTLELKDEVKIQFENRREIFGGKQRTIYAERLVDLPPGRSHRFRIRRPEPGHQLWLTRASEWVATPMNEGHSSPRAIEVTNISDHEVRLRSDDAIGLWLAPGYLPRRRGFVSPGSRRCREWENLAYQATTDLDDREIDEAMVAEGVLAQTEFEKKHEAANCKPAQQNLPAVEKPTYQTPRRILRHSDGRDVPKACRLAVAGPPDPLLSRGIPVNSVKDVMETQGSGPRILAAVTAAECIRDDDGDDAVYIHESSDLQAEDLDHDMAVLPEIYGTARAGDLKKEELDVGDPAVNTPDEIHRMREIIWRRRNLLIGQGNALPPAAKGVVCDIDVKGASPIAQKVRSVPPKFREKLFELIKGLLATKIIEPSQSPWASPIVIVVKKNKVDIRLCIDYRLVNSLTDLMVYPMPTTHDLLEDLGSMQWFCSLDMASGFWVIPMTPRAQAISAFITPFGLFQWNRMPFGLKNAPQIYQRMLDNALYNLLRIPPEGIPDDSLDVFDGGDPADPKAKSVLQRRSYIDDVLFGAATWDEMCEKVERLMQVCEEWNISISAAKSSWGKQCVEYLGHRVSHAGIQAKPKNLDALVDLPLPRTLKALQSFLGSLNYYAQFIQHHAVYAAILYELTDDDLTGDPTTDVMRRARRAFDVLKEKLRSTPMLEHFDPDREVGVITYECAWAISSAVVQPHDGIWKPVKFTGRVLKPNELNYHPAEREILALLRTLNVCYPQLEGRRIRVITRSTTMAWLWKTKTLQGRLGQWAALLAPWELEIMKAAKGETEVLGLLAASLVPRDKADEALEQIQPKKSQRRPPVVAAHAAPLLRPGITYTILSFDGSAKPKRAGGSCSGIAWSWPSGEIRMARSRYLVAATVNEAEYQGARLALQLALELEAKHVIIIGDSNLVVRQLRGEIECKAPQLQILKGEVTQLLAKFQSVQLIHAKREYNQPADLLARRTTMETENVNDPDPELWEELRAVSRLPEILPATVEEDPTLAGIGEKADDVEPAPILAVQTRSQSRPTAVEDATTTERDPFRRTPGDPPERNVTGIPDISDGSTEEDYIRKRRDRIRAAQEEEEWISDLKLYLAQDLRGIPDERAERCAKVAANFELDQDDMLVYISQGRQSRGSEAPEVRIVVPEGLRRDLLHHYHASIEGGHQGVGRTYGRIRKHFYWPGLYRDTQQYVGECPDCETGKGKPGIRGISPGNIVATYPFQVIAMDHIPSLPASHHGNTELLIFVDLFSGYLITKANASRTAQAVAETYESAVYRRFGASEYIRHDREASFMSEFFREFNRLMGQRQRATLAYRPQANGAAERKVQVITRAIKMYVVDPEQRDWDEYAERLVFALNTMTDDTRKETPFYLVHGWDPRTTVEAMLAVGNPEIQGRDPRRWRFQIQRSYQRARAEAIQLVRNAVQQRAEAHNDGIRDPEITAGDQVWLYLDRVRPGYAKKLTHLWHYAKKLAHLWHGPFRVAVMESECVARLEIAGSEYEFFPLVHVSKLRRKREWPARPQIQLTVEEGGRVDFDEALLPEDSWSDLRDGDYEVTEILDRRTTRAATRGGKPRREYLVQWAGDHEASWVEEQDLNCGGLLYDFELRRRAEDRLNVMETPRVGRD